MAKPLGLAERIRQAKKKNLPADELEKEKNLLNNLNLHSLKIVKDAKTVSLDNSKPPHTIPYTEQTNKQTDNQSINQTIEQTNNRANGHLPKQTLEQMPEQTIDQSTKQTSKQTNEQEIEQTTEQTNKRAGRQTTEQTDNRANEQTSLSSNIFQDIDLSLKPKDLKENQFKVLHYIYFNRPFVVKSLGDHLSIRYGTVRNCLNSLIKKLYIDKPFRINDGVFNGSYCNVNELKCFKLFGPNNINEPEYNTEQTSTWTNGQTSKQTNTWTNEQIDRQTSKRVNEQTFRQSNNLLNKQTNEQSNDSYNSKSVSINKNLLTTQFETDPNLKYWRDKDLQIQKIISWMNEFNFSEEQILNQLRYCAFEWKNKTSEEVRKPVGKFYTALANGGFEKPEGYKTPEEKRCDIINAEIQEKEKILQEIKAKNKRLRDLSFEIWFEELSPKKRKEIINNSTLTKKQKEKGSGPAIDAVLRSYYEENIEE